MNLHACQKSLYCAKYQGWSKLSTGASAAPNQYTTSRVFYLSRAILSTGYSRILLADVVLYSGFSSRGSDFEAGVGTRLDTLRLLSIAAL
ncbi:hypothetical protein MRX96_015224 [Rhipicephalus microplus]